MQHPCICGAQEVACHEACHCTGAHCSASPCCPGTCRSGSAAGLRTSVASLWTWGPLHTSRIAHGALLKLQPRAQVWEHDATPGGQLETRRSFSACTVVVMGKRRGPTSPCGCRNLHHAGVTCQPLHSCLPGSCAVQQTACDLTLGKLALCRVGLSCRALQLCHQLPLERALQVKLLCSPSHLPQQLPPDVQGVAHQCHRARLAGLHRRQALHIVPAQPSGARHNHELAARLSSFSG